MKENLTIRSATINDGTKLLAIYAPYVEETAISFEYEVPTVEEFQRRIEQTLKKYPYLVACQEDRIIGYAYASPLKERQAYAYSVEVSIYVGKDFKRLGIGKRLYLALEEELRRRGFLNIYAYIACPCQDDEYLTRDSIEFHKHMNYRLVGKFRKCGYKFGHWYNIVCMEKLIGEHKMA